MGYRQITSDERYMISTLRKQGFNPAQTANILGRHRSSITREIHRNATAADGGYRPFTASERARGRRSRSRRNTRFTASQWTHVHRGLRRQWSPEQIAGRLRRDGTWTISHETIYAHIWYDKARGGSLFRDLRCATKRRRKRHGTYDSRGRLAGKRMIAERPDTVDRRTTQGHWEVDTVVGTGAPDCVATLVERKTGFTMLGKLRNRTSRGMTRRLRQLIRRAPRAFKTVTADNGTEFHDYGAVEATTRLTFYFATPYHAWERGSNENLNGLLRQYLPKRTSLAGLTQRHCDALALRLNSRPRKRLGYRTPAECFHAN
jgi:transposase, IS30 family